MCLLCNKIFSNEAMKPSRPVISNVGHYKILVGRGGLRHWIDFEHLAFFSVLPSCDFVNCVWVCFDVTKNKSAYRCYEKRPINKTTIVLL